MTLRKQNKKQVTQHSDNEDADDNAKSETTSKDDLSQPSESDDDDDDDETKTAPRTDKEEIIYIVAKRLWSDDFEETAAALASFLPADHARSRQQ
jgi:hypothetical protein